MNDDDEEVNNNKNFLVGRMLQIASGESNLPITTVLQYRNLWENQGYVLPPLDVENEIHVQSLHSFRKSSPRRQHHVRSTNGYGPGSQLLKLYSNAGVPHCQSCFSLAAKMDAWGVQECKERIDEIVNDILPRAKSWLVNNKPWVQKLLAGVGVEESALRVRLRRDVTRAIENAALATPKAVEGLQKGRTGFRPKDWAVAFNPGVTLPQFITNEQFASDTLKLVSMLPPNITAVAGVARSGLHPATMISMMLHVPLIVIRHHQADWLPAGNGWRLNEGRPVQDGITLVVDDTTMTGNSLQRTKHVITDMPGPKMYAAIYVNPAAKAKPDLWAVDLPWPHLLQWNLFNSVMMDSCAFDFDGVLCHDCPSSDDDDGPRYDEFLRNATPRHLIRKRKIQLIVTARLEKYREQTMDWLDRWGIAVDQLVMGPWKSLQERRLDDVAAFKANALKKWFATDAKIRPKIFIESDPRQAQRIANLTGGLVACPNGQCFRGGES
ncbi:hypothetical protein [Thalassoglobus sp.]|uniref:hypothetical protein n=1 Tax=Thalassoglobus sp. TaxID=2795869 RepID=UPI003AA809BC